MITLALDTTTPGGGVALLKDAVLAASVDGDPSRTHGVRLPGDILRMLETEAIRLPDIDLYAVASGPGGFTGLRVGMATVQGLALVHGRPVVPVSALDASARAAVSTDEPVRANDLIGVWLDAHRGDVFSALYGLDGRDGVRVPVILEAAAVSTPGEALRRWRGRVLGRRLWLTGAGAARYGAEAAAGGATDEIPSAANLAAMVGAMAVESAHRGETVPPHELIPLYVRRPDAELARLRQEAR